MATYAQLGALSFQNEFQSRVAYAMNVAAVAIYNEGTGITGHVARATYATKVVNGTYNLQAACLAVATSTAIAGEANLAIAPGNSIPDTDIQTSVNSIWNTLAGA